LTVYVRDYPKDYKTGEVHPNKLKTWLAFSEATTEMRGKKYEDIIENVIRKMAGKKFKAEIRPKKKVSWRDYFWLKVQAANKGVDPDLVDQVVEVEEKWKKVLEPVFNRLKVGIVAGTRP